MTADPIAEVLVEPVTTLITEPGVYPDVTEAAYHRDPVAGGSLSSTGARLLVAQTPAHFDHARRYGRPDKVHFDLGRAVHDDLLGGGAPVIAVHAPDWKTKAAQAERAAIRADGGTPLLAHQYEQVKAMAAAVRQHPYAGKLFARDGRSELTIVARDPESGVMCRVRVDWMPDRRPGRPLTFVDVKTAESVHPAKLARSMADHGYHQQLPFYEDTVAGGSDVDVAEVQSILVAVEKAPPHVVVIAEPDEQAIAWGRVLNAKARDIYRQCAATGVWPGYEPRPIPLSLPGYVLAAYEAASDAGAYDLTHHHPAGDPS